MQITCCQQETQILLRHNLDGACSYTYFGRLMHFPRKRLLIDLILVDKCMYCDNLHDVFHRYQSNHLLTDIENSLTIYMMSINC